MFSDSASRNSPPEIFCQKVVLKISAIFTGKHKYHSVHPLSADGGGGGGCGGERGGGGG